MAKKDMYDILKAADKKINTPQGIKGVLARLARQIYANLNVGPIAFESYLVDFLSRRRTPNTRNDRQVVQGNLIKHFSKPTMTWPVLCQLLSFLRIWKFRLIIECYHENGKVSVHSVEHALGKDPSKRMGGSHEETADSQTEDPFSVHDDDAHD